MSQPCEHLAAAYQHLVSQGLTFRERQPWGNLTLILESDREIDWKALKVHFPLVLPLDEFFEQDPRWRREGLTCWEHHQLIVAPYGNQPKRMS